MFSANRVEGDHVFLVLARVVTLAIQRSTKGEI